MHKQILETLKSDTNQPEGLEELLAKLGDQDPGFVYLLEKFRIEKKKILARSWPTWFSRLGWWFAKLLMYSTAGAAFVVVAAAGKEAVSPLTYGLIGAGVYYAIIQLFTPARIDREIAFLKVDDEKASLQKILARINEEKAD